MSGGGGRRKISRIMKRAKLCNHGALWLGISDPAVFCAPTRRRLEANSDAKNRLRGNQHVRPLCRSSSCIFSRCRRDTVRCGRPLAGNDESVNRLIFPPLLHRHLSRQLPPSRQQVDGCTTRRQLSARSEHVRATRTAAESRRNSRMPAKSKCCGRNCLAL